jgi:hypothetical protein
MYRPGERRGTIRLRGVDISFDAKQGRKSVLIASLYRLEQTKIFLLRSDWSAQQNSHHEPTNPRT